MNKKYVVHNIVASIITQMVSIVISLVVPRLMIVQYGSEVNGLISSVQQMVRYFALLEGGISAAAGFHLFRALRDKDYERINSVYSAINVFFFKSGLFLMGATVLFAFLFPLASMGSGTYMQSVSIVLMLCVVSVVGYLVFFKYDIILFSDQKQYIIVNACCIANALIAALQVVLMVVHAHILWIVAVAPAVTTLRQLLIRRYIVGKYDFLDKHARPAPSSLDQKWDSLTINLSKMLKTIVPIGFITYLFGFEYASIFNVYAMVLRIGSSIIETSGNGLAASMGNLVAARDGGSVARVYNNSSYLMFFVIALLSVCFYFLLGPFIELYIGRSADINYLSPLLGVTFIINEGLNNLRFTPNLLIRATGHLKQTSKSAVTEIILALVLTPVGCLLLGYQGALLGSLCASLYRTVYISAHCRRNILGGGMGPVLRLTLLFGAEILAAIVLIGLIPLRADSYAQWLLCALAVGLSALAVLTGLSWALSRRQFRSALSMVMKKKGAGSGAGG